MLWMFMLFISHFGHIAPLLAAFYLAFSSKLQYI